MPTILLTERLRLRPLLLSDQYAMYRLDSSPSVMRYIGEGGIKSFDESEQYFLQALEISKGQIGYWIAESINSNTFVGCFVLKQLEQSDKIELGYRLLEKFWGQGLATEGAKEIVRYAMEELHIEELVAITIPQNTASHKVLFKLGFEHKGAGQYYGIFAEYFSKT